MPSLGREPGKAPSHSTPSARTCDRSFSRSPDYHRARCRCVTSSIGGVAPGCCARNIRLAPRAWRETRLFGAPDRRKAAQRVASHGAHGTPVTGRLYRTGEIDDWRREADVAGPRAQGCQGEYLSLPSPDTLEASGLARPLSVHRALQYALNFSLPPDSRACDQSRA